jgi:hypothetical protein
LTPAPLAAAPLLFLLACTGEEPTAPALPALPPRIEQAGLGAAGEARPLREAVIALTGELRGEIEACGCAVAAYGGFARRGVLLDALRDEGLPVFVVDVGEMLVRGQVAADPGDRPARARAVLDLARGTGLDAWAPAPIDLLAGGLGGLSGTGALSATWQDTGGQPVFPGAQVIERDGLRLGVVGISAPADGLRAVDPVDAARAAITAAGPADTWVALSNASAEDTRRVAEAVPGLGAVLSVRNGTHDLPLATAGAPIIETPDRGRYVTILRLSLASDGAPWQVVSGGVYDEMADLHARIPQLPTPEAKAAAGAKLTDARARLATTIAGHDVVTVEDHPLGSDLDAPSGLEARIAAFEASSTQAARDRAAAAPPVAGYATSNACVHCHEARFAAWSLTDHARALEPLIPRHAETNPECIGCHATGWGEPGGFAEATPTLLQTWKAVQCEACHGPMAGHPDQGTPARPVTEETCIRCHDAANSPGFDYAKALPRTSCVMASRQEADGGAAGLPVGKPLGGAPVPTPAVPGH